MSKRGKGIDGFNDYLNRKKKLELRLDQSRFEPSFMRTESILREANRRNFNMGFGFAADDIAKTVKSTWDFGERLGGLGSVWDNNTKQNLTNGLYLRFERPQAPIRLGLDSNWGVNFTQGFQEALFPLYEKFEPLRGVGRYWNSNLKQGLAASHFSQDPYYYKLFKGNFNSISSITSTVADSLPNVSELIPKSYSDISGTINVTNPKIEVGLPRIINDFNFKDLINIKSIEIFLKNYKGGHSLLKSTYTSQEYLHNKIKDIFRNIFAENINDLYDKAIAKIRGLINIPAIVRFLIEYHVGIALGQLYAILGKMFMVALISVPPDAPHSASEYIRSCYVDLLGVDIVEQVVQEALVTPVELVVRNEDNLNAEIVGSIKEGGHVLLSEVQGEWAFVGYYDDEGHLSEGWVQYKYLISLGGR